jgi:hypothetical protein
MRHDDMSTADFPFVTTKLNSLQGDLNYQHNIISSGAPIIG